MSWFIFFKAKFKISLIKIYFLNYNFLIKDLIKCAISNEKLNIHAYFT